MNDILYSIAGILIPFIGTSLGSSLVFFLKKDMNEKVQKLTVGFAAGVMIAASVWSLILPAVEMAEEQGAIPWIPAAVGLIAGVVFLLVINNVAEKFESKKDGKKLNMLMLSVTLHNIPEGMAVGVIFAGFLSGNAGIALIEAVVLAVRNSNTKHSRRCNNFNATKNARRKQEKSIYLRGFVRHS